MGAQKDYYFFLFVCAGRGSGEEAVAVMASGLMVWLAEGMEALTQLLHWGSSKHSGVSRPGDRQCGAAASGLEG